jgi:ribonuclease R
LHDVEGTPEENVINEVTLRSMAKAIYSEDNIGHYGLGFSFYTHFTSPIRRYPDLVVHRLIVEYERGTTPGYEKQLRSRLHLVGKWSSGRERVAMEAERDAVKVMQVEYMKRHVGDEFEGVISGVLHYGLFVELNDVLVEGRIHVRDLGDDYYLHDEKHYSLVGQRTGNAFRLGDIIQVKVVRVDMDRREIDFSCVPPKSMKKKRTS